MYEKWHSILEMGMGNKDVLVQETVNQTQMQLKAGILKGEKTLPPFATDDTSSIL